MKRLFTIFLLITMPFFAQSKKRAITIEDLYKTVYVGSQQISHDGSKVLFTVTKSNLKEARTNTDVYLVNADGSGLRQLTVNKAADYNPIWSKDDKSVYFVSARNGKPQLFKLPLNGGEAVQETHCKYGISSPKLSADGNKILFQAKIFPECGTDYECNKKNLDGMLDGPVQAHLADSLFVRHWTKYNDGRYTHVLLLNLQDSSLTDLTPGFYNSPTFAAGGSDHYEFSPDFSEVTFDSKRVENPESSTNSDVWTVLLNAGELTNITKENKAYDGDPKYSPDGKYIAYKTQETPGYESDMFNLAIYNRKSGERKILTEAFDNWVNDFEWSRDSKFIYFTAFEQGYMPLFKINVNTLKIQKLIPNKVIASFQISPGEKFAVVSYSKIDKPYELARFDFSAKKFKDITSINRKIREEVDFRPAEQLWIKGADGIPVQTFLIKPHNFDPNKKYPFIINVHGGPQYQWMDSFRFDWQVYPAAGYVLAFPNPHGSIGFGQKYTAEISKDWDGKVFVDVMKVTDSLAKLSFVDSTRMGAMGWSYGGYFMNLLQAKTHRFKCLASMMGIYDLSEFKEETEELWFANWDLGNNYESKSPSNYVNNFKTPALIITGQKDFRIPYTQSIRYFTNLQLKGIDSRLIIFKNDGHWPSFLKSMPLYYNAHLEWFHKYLGGKPAPWDSKKMVRNLQYK
ncbi:prolyl tripeptidyl peptidase precursor [bacterium BMS3Abin04]|nr:prolyl tripeptidyl peptidase precursor [bacterium BMS3Abin04]